eukprot:gene100-101_t
MVASSDILVASERASLGLPEVDVGLLGGCSHAMRLFGHSRVRRMMLTGWRVPAQDLYRTGVVEACTPHEELLPVALELARTIAAKSPVSTRMGKHTLNTLEDLGASLRDGYRYEQDMTAQISQTADAKEAQSAFPDDLGAVPLRALVARNPSVDCGVNDGACALLIASKSCARTHGLTPRARVIAMAAVGVPPRVMGIGPAPATMKVLAMTELSLAHMDVIELNEAFAARGLAVLRQLSLQDDDPRVNPNGGAIALGHPLGASGARLVMTAVNQLHRVGQGIAVVIE